VRSSLRSSLKSKASGLLCACLLACALAAPRPASAGSGYYYGAHFGFFDFFENAGRFENADGGFTFGPKVGAYFIASWLALALDASVQVGLVGDDKDAWYIHLPTIGIAAGTGFDAFMLYVGGAFSLAGIDNLGDELVSNEIRASLLNPYAYGGLQIGYGGFIARGEFQIGRTFRINADDYAYTNIAITIGYGLYADFL
jgi:hypothetical protein